mgnify:CR=1 FL=1
MQYTVEEIKELVNLGFTVEQITQMSAKSSKSKSAPLSDAEHVARGDIKSKNGNWRTVAQQANDAKLKEHAAERKEAFDKMCKEWEKSRKKYKPSHELIDAIKTNRCSITHKVAKEQYGFVGTKKDLLALKNNICK